MKPHLHSAFIMIVPHLQIFEIESSAIWMSEPLCQHSGPYRLFLKDRFKLWSGPILVQRRQSSMKRPVTHRGIFTLTERMRRSIFQRSTDHIMITVGVSKTIQNILNLNRVQISLRPLTSRFYLRPTSVLI